MEKPGFCGKEIMTFEGKLFYSVAQFINSLDGRVADMGCFNAKSSYLKVILNNDIEQVDRNDFNFWDVPKDYKNVFDTILCLEVLEHLQNPLLFMRNLKAMLKRDGIIYLSLPARPRFLWTEHHFFEMNKRHLIKRIFNPLGLEIIESQRIRINHSWLFYISGFRPFFRIFFNYTHIYKIKIK